MDLSTRHFPIGAMGTFQGLCGMYVLKLTEVFAVVHKRESVQHVSNFPIGAMGTFERVRAQLCCQ
jgi:hypothetical protein